MTNTRLGAMDCSDWRDIETGEVVRWKMKISLLTCLNEYPATETEGLLEKAVSSFVWISRCPVPFVHWHLVSGFFSVGLVTSKTTSR